MRSTDPRTLAYWIPVLWTTAPTLALSIVVQDFVSGRGWSDGWVMAYTIGAPAILGATVAIILDLRKPPDEKPEPVFRFRRTR